jgi:hypothetical protein
MKLSLLDWRLTMLWAAALYAGVIAFMLRFLVALVQEMRWLRLARGQRSSFAYHFTSLPFSKGSGTEENYCDGKRHPVHRDHSGDVCADVRVVARVRAA